MDWDDYLRDEARKYGRLAEEADGALIKQELLELADICEKVANNIEDHMTAG
jgi:cytidylate kinase